MVEDRLQAHRGIADHPLRGRCPAPGRAVAGVGMREREDPAEVAPAAPVAHEQGDVAASTCAADGVLGQIELGAVDRPDPIVGRDLRQLHRPGDRVVVGQSERRIAQFARALRQLLRQRDAVQERVGRVAVQLDVRPARRHPSLT